MAATRYIYTIARVARMLGEDEALLEDIAADMDPEDGCLAIQDLDDDISTTAFTAFGIENLEELLATSSRKDYPHSRRRLRLIPRYSPDGYESADVADLARPHSEIRSIIARALVRLLKTVSCWKE